MTKAQARDLLWRTGNLRLLLGLHEGQIAVAEKISSSQERLHVLCCARRWGKSYLCGALALEKCFSEQNNHVFFAAKTKHQALRNLVPMVKNFLATCPESLPWKFNKVSSSFHIQHTNMTLHVVGLDEGRAETIRGAGCVRFVVDEAGSINNLDYIVEDIIFPTTLGLGGEKSGDVLLLSTPPPSAAHPFVEYIAKAKALDTYMHYTVYQNPRLPPKALDEERIRCGGEDTVTWRREMLAEVVTDPKHAVVPEFLTFQHRVVRDTPAPGHYHPYVIADFGFNDLTIVLFGYYNFDTDRLVVVDELVFSRSSTSDMVDPIKERVKVRFASRKPHYYGDADLLVLADLRRSGLPFRPVSRGSVEAAVNMLRKRISGDQIEIHPRCKTLIDHLNYAVWAPGKTSFKRIEGYGHFDGVAALMYAVHHMEWGRNPYPEIKAVYTTRGAEPRVVPRLNKPTNPLARSRRWSR